MNDINAKSNTYPFVEVVIYSEIVRSICRVNQSRFSRQVPFLRLILKLKSHGMGNSIINWIEQRLTDRRQRVVVDGEVSSWKSVLSGVPQGSVLGPILFLVYINDLEEGVTGKLLKFADDTKLFRKTKEIGYKLKLQDDIDQLVRWSEKWQMLFNFGKCRSMSTHRAWKYWHEL